MLSKCKPSSASWRFTYYPAENREVWRAATAVWILLCCFQLGLIAPHSSNNHRGQINSLVLHLCKKNKKGMIREHTDSDKPCDRVMNGETPYGEVNTSYSDRRNNNQPLVAG